MPEHLHILLTPSDEISIERAMQIIKGGSSHRIGTERPQAFPVWQRSFHDNWIRDAQQFWQAKSYIERNPVKAGLVRAAEEYAWSSTNGKIVLDRSRYEEPAAKAFGSGR